MKLLKNKQPFRSNSRPRKNKANLQGIKKIRLPPKKRRPLPDKRAKSQRRKKLEDPPKRSKTLLIFWNKVSKSQRLLKSREQGQSRERIQRTKRGETKILPQKKNLRKKEWWLSIRMGSTTTSSSWRTTLASSLKTRPGLADKSCLKKEKRGKKRLFVTRNIIDIIKYIFQPPSKEHHPNYSIEKSISISTINTTVVIQANSKNLIHRW